MISESSLISILTYTTPVSEHLLCPICTEPLLNPRRIDFCGHTFCSSCLNQWFARQRTCPECRSQFKAVEPADRIVRSLLDELEVHCRLCEVTGPRGRHSSFECHIAFAVSYLNKYHPPTSYKDTVEWKTVENLLSIAHESSVYLKEVISVLLTKNELHCIGKHALCIDILITQDKSALVSRLSTLIEFLAAGCAFGCNCADKTLLKIVEAYSLPLHPPALEILGETMCKRLETISEQTRMETGNSVISQIVKAVLRLFPKCMDFTEKIMASIVNVLKSANAPLIQECIALSSILIINHDVYATKESIRQLAGFISTLFNLYPHHFQPFGVQYLKVMGKLIKWHYFEPAEVLNACVSCVGVVSKVIGPEISQVLDPWMLLTNNIWRFACSRNIDESGVAFKNSITMTIMHTYADIFYALKGKEYCLLFYMDKIFDFMSWSLSAVELDSIVLSVVTLLRDFGHTFSEGELFRLYSMEFVELAMEKLDGLDDEMSVYTELKLATRNAVKRQLIPITQVFSNK